MSELGEKIITAIAPTMGLALREIALKIGVKQATVSRYLNRQVGGGIFICVDGLWRMTEHGIKLADGMTFPME